MALKVALDAMGGDFSPGEVIRGALEAVREGDMEVVLVGPEEAVKAELTKGSPLPPGISWVNASQVIGMDEHPATAIRSKPQSSIVVAMNLVKSVEAHAFVSAGNTGAVMAAALLILGRKPGVERPPLATVFPTLKGPVLILDVGANADCKPVYLEQFAHLGSEYVEKVLGVPNPRVGLLNIGEEETKGSRLAQEAYELLKKSGLNFMGNVEGKDVPRGVADVVVTDGFTGNVALKVAEGVGDMILQLLRDALTRDLKYRFLALLLRPALRSVAHRLDYAEYGGAPLLGVKGVVIVAHGRSNARAIKNALLIAKRATLASEGDLQ